MARRDPHTPRPRKDPIPPRPPTETTPGPVTRQARHTKQSDENRFQAILELAPDAIIVSSVNGRIILVNRQAELLFGYDRAALLGRDIEILIPERCQQELRQRRAGYAADPHAPFMKSGLRLFGLRLDGSEFPAEINLSPLENDGESLVIATIRDVSEWKRVEAAHIEAEATNQELHQLLALTDTALSSLPLDDLLGELLIRVREALRVDNVAILLLDESGRELHLKAARGLEEEGVGKQRVPVGQGFAGRIVAMRAPLVVDDLSTYPVINPLLRERLRSAMGAPLVAGARLLGVIHADSATFRHFHDHDVHLLELAGERIALAIDRARLLATTLAARAEAEREGARWQAAMDSAPAFVITCDPALRITYINPAFERLLGSQLDPAASLDIYPAQFRLPTPDGSAPIAPDQSPLARALREERVIPGIELLYRSPSGEERLVSWDTAPMRARDDSMLGAVSVGWDITDQRQLEREARDHTAQLEAIFEAVTDGLIVYDSDGRVILSNATTRAQLARFIPTTPGETLRERNAQTLPTDEDGKLLPAERWAQTRALRGEVVSGENPVTMLLRAPNGEEAAFEVTAAPLRDVAGEIVGAVTVNRDVTAVKQLERQHQEARARELAATEVSRRLDEFFVIAAHDIRNPVTAVYTSVQMALRRFNRLQAEMAASATKDQTAVIDAIATSLGVAERSVERLIRLIDRLFDVAQARAGALKLRFTPCDLATIAREQVAEQRAASPGRAIHLTLPDERPVMVIADADRLGETLANYLTNAIKYSAEDRPVAVELKVVEGRAVVAVRDEGPGIPPEEQLLVWEMFHRASGAAPLDADAGRGASMGLGLHICKRLIEGHPGGQVGVESEVGAGATFWFSLPLASDAPPSDAE